MPSALYRLTGSTGKIFCHPDLPKKTRIFVCPDAQCKALEPLFDGLFSIISLSTKLYTLHLPSCHDTISVDRLKPAFLDISDVPDVAGTDVLLVTASQKQALISYVPLMCSVAP